MGEGDTWEGNIWGMKDLIDGKHQGRETFGEERFNLRKTFGGGKHLGMKDSIDGKN